MTVQEYLIEYPTESTIINNINTLFESFNMCVNEVIRTAQIIRYNLNLPLDLKALDKVRKAEKSIEFALSAALDSDDVNYGKTKKNVFVERKNDTFKPIDCQELLKSKPDGLMLLLGKDINGKSCYTDLRKAPHILVAGTTGSGKSELLHNFIASIIGKCFIYVIDPKRSEFSVYKDRAGINVISEMSEAVTMLRKSVEEMERRYRLLEERKLKDIDLLNDPSIKPYCIIIDELKDMLMQDKSAEQYIVRLAQKARACGIHLIIGTQTPRADVITGGIKANIPTKIALHTSNQLESRIIFDQNGAEQLFGKGDMLYLANGSFTPIRIQAAYMNESEKERLANSLPYKPSTRFESQTTDRKALIEYHKQAMAQYDQPQPKKKRVGLIQGLINIWNTKPIMFRTDDYPPKI